MPRCRGSHDLCSVGKLVHHAWMGSWGIQRWVIYGHDIDTICFLASMPDQEVEGWWGARTSNPSHSESWVIEERQGMRCRRRADRRYWCWERFKDGSHTSCQVLGWGMQSDDLTALRRGRAAQQPHCISPSTFVVLFGMDQESPNGAQNMEVGWKPKNELEPAKCLWSSSQVNRGQGKTSPHPSSREGLAWLV